VYWSMCNELCSITQQHSDITVGELLLKPLTYDRVLTLTAHCVHHIIISIQDKSFLTAVTSALGDDSSDGGDNANTDEDCDYEN
jgi:hypothetical protein